MGISPADCRTISQYVAFGFISSICFAWTAVVSIRLPFCCLASSSFWSAICNALAMTASGLFHCFSRFKKYSRQRLPISVRCIIQSSFAISMVSWWSVTSLETLRLPSIWTRTFLSELKSMPSAKPYSHILGNHLWYGVSIMSAAWSSRPLTVGLSLSYFTVIVISFI